MALGLRFDPMGGGQFKKFVEGLIEAERAPIRTLEQRKQVQEQKLKTFQDFKTRVGTLERSLEEVSTFRKWVEYKVDLGDGSQLVDVTLDKTKVKPGSYQIEVVELAQSSSVISNPVTDPNATVGTGNIVLRSQDGSKQVIEVDSRSSSLRGIAALINSQKDSLAQASVVQDVYDPENRWRLIVTSKRQGLEDAIDYPEFYLVGGSSDFYVDDTHAAQNAVLRVDGFEIETEANKVSEFLEGINLNIKQARPDQPFILTVTEDTQKISGKISAIIKQVNEVLGFINQQNKVDDKSDTRTTFTGDTSLQNVEYRLRNLMHEGFPIWDPVRETYRSMNLHEIGVEFKKDGSLALNEEKFNKLVSDNIDDVGEAIAGEQGFVSQLREVVRLYTRPTDGLISVKEKGLRDRIDTIDKNIADKERILERRAQSLTSQFSRLQSSLGSLQQQQQYLQATLGGAGGGSVAQLLGG